jgi:hypothetical protein
MSNPKQWHKLKEEALKHPVSFDTTDVVDASGALKLEPGSKVWMDGVEIGVLTSVSIHASSNDVPVANWQAVLPNGGSLEGTFVVGESGPLASSVVSSGDSVSLEPDTDDTDVDLSQIATDLDQLPETYGALGATKWSQTLSAAYLSEKWMVPTNLIHDEAYTLKKNDPAQALEHYLMKVVREIARGVDDGTFKLPANPTSLAAAFPSMKPEYYSLNSAPPPTANIIKKIRLTLQED